MSKPVIGFVGMTHLGLNSCIAAAEKGFELIGFDPSTQLINEINSGNFPVSEPQLVELAQKNKSHLRFTSDVNELKKCDVVYVAPDVSTNDQGESDLTTITALLDLALESTRADCVIVVLSQVPPGFTRGKLKAGRSIYYQVETLIFGQAIHRALYPERYIIGCENPEAPISRPFAQFLEAHSCPILPMRFESAELAKISINMCLVASVSTANTLAELCEKIGADWLEIVPALKLDRRIGQYSYLSPGLGISGGNLERDLATVCYLGDKNNTDVGVVRSWIRNSQHRKDWPLQKIEERLSSISKSPVIAILGLSYKEDTHSIKNSPAISLIKNLQANKIRVYDPVVSSSEVIHPDCFGASSAIEACDGADILVIMTPWKEFFDLSLKDIATSLSGNLVIDPYGVLKKSALHEANVEYLTLGK
jgi:UDPglucose 6-dehydrogenase